MASVVPGRAPRPIATASPGWRQQMVGDERHGHRRDLTKYSARLRASVLVFDNQRQLVPPDCR
jgi:hypothetical protein